jgi:hypothetical protein
VLAYHGPSTLCFHVVLIVGSAFHDGTNQLVGLKQEFDRIDRLAAYPGNRVLIGLRTHQREYAKASSLITTTSLPCVCFEIADGPWP